MAFNYLLCKTTTFSSNYTKTSAKIAMLENVIKQHFQLCLFIVINRDNYASSWLKKFMCNLKTFIHE